MTTTKVQSQTTVVNWVKFRDLAAYDGATLLIRQENQPLKLGTMFWSGFGSDVIVNGESWDYDLDADVAVLEVAALRGGA